MTDDLKLCLKILDDAIAFEEEGMKFFRERERNAPSEVERRIFNSLAKDEAGHRAHLVKMKQELTETRDVEALRQDDEDVHRSAREIFEEALADSIEPEAYVEEDLEILRGALEVERKGYRIYSEGARSIGSPRAKAIFEDLAQQEVQHFELLKNTMDYLADPAAFRAYDGNPMLDGG